MQISSYFCDGNLAILADVVLAQDIGSLPPRGSDLISHGQFRLKPDGISRVLTISQLSRGRFLFPIGNPSFAVDSLSLC